MSFADRIKNIIESHKKHDANNIFWKNKLANNKDCLAVLKEIEKNESNHHVGDFYKHHGLKIDENSDRVEAKNLKTIMNYIKEKWEDEDGHDENFIREDKKTEEGEPGSESDGKEKFVEAEDDKKKKDQKRSLISVDLPEETYIKTLAISILSLTNGECNFAKKLLDNGGIKAMKSMSVKELKGLAENLEVLSANLSIAHSYNK